MLKPIKTFYSEINPTYSIFEEAKQIAIEEDCVVELRWLPHIMAGWHHEYVYANSDPAELANRYTVYGI